MRRLLQSHACVIYREQNVVIARDAMIEQDTAIGAGTHVDESAVVSLALQAPLQDILQC